MRPRRAHHRPAWVPSPLVLAAIGFLVIGIGVLVWRGSDTVPDGWVVTDAVATRELHGRTGGVAIEWTTEGGVRMDRLCEDCAEDVGDPVRIAYDPAEPTSFKALGQFRLLLAAMLFGGAALVTAAILVALFLPPQAGAIARAGPATGLDGHASTPA